MSCENWLGSWIYGGLGPCNNVFSSKGVVICVIKFVYSSLLSEIISSWTLQISHFGVYCLGAKRQWN